MPTTKPKKPTNAQLSAAQLERVVSVLREARSSSHYPLTVAQLADHMHLDSDDVLKLVVSKAVKSKLLLSAKDPAAPIVLIEDSHKLAESEGLLHFAATHVRTKRNGAVRKPLKDFVADSGITDKNLKSAFKHRLEKLASARSLSDDILALLPAPRASVGDIATRLAKVVQSQRHGSADYYPVSQAMLFSLADIPGDKLSKSALKHPNFTEQVVGGKAGFVSRADIRSPSGNLIKNLFDVALADALKKKGKRTNILAVTEVAAVIAPASKGTKPLNVQLATAIEQAAQRHELPAEIGWLYLNGQRVFFRRQDVEPAIGTTTPKTDHSAILHERRMDTPSTAHPPGKFAEAFDAAFDRVNYHGGSRNFVKVLELRNALPQFSREQFDASLRELRLARRYTMEADNGGSSRLTDEEHRAGIQEGRFNLVFVSRI